MFEFEDFSLDDVSPLEAKEAEAKHAEMEPTPEEIAVAEGLVYVRSLLNSMKEEIAAFQKLRDDVQTEAKVLREKINLLNQKDQEIKIAQFDVQREMRKVEQEAEQKERQLKQARENRHLRIELAKQEVEFEELTKDAPWRKDAMKHQYEGAKTLANAKKAILGDKRGLGKTLTSLIYADMLQAKKIICFVPGDVIRTFEREIQHWAPHRTVAPLGMMPKKNRKFAISMLKKLDSFVITVNYEAWRRDKSLLQDLIELQCDTVICDEAHLMKNKKGGAFSGVEEVVFAPNKCSECGGVPELAKHAQYTYMFVPTCTKCQHQASNIQAWEFCSVENVLPMTGTPILNKPQDLFPLLSLIDRATFHDEYRFLMDYCERDLYTQKWKFASGGLDRLINKMSSRFLVRDRKSAGVILPEQHETIYELELTPEEYPEQWRAAKVLNDYAQVLLGDDKALNIMYTIALITRKRQMMTWPEGIKWVDAKTKEVQFQVSCKESIKIDRIINVEESPVGSVEGFGLIPELTADGSWTEGERVVVFSQFKEPLKELERRCNLAGISVVRFDGDTSDALRDEIVVDFDRKYCNQDGYQKKWQVVLANYKKGGQVLNLTDATQMIILDEEWNPGKVDQAYGRIDRMGQTEETTVHVLRVKGSVDTWMAALIAEKKEMIEGFEQKHNLAQEMLEAIRKGEML